MDTRALVHRKGEKVNQYQRAWPPLAGHGMSHQQGRGRWSEQGGCSGLLRMGDGRELLILEVDLISGRAKI